MGVADPAFDARVIELYSNDLSGSQIAKILPCVPTTVYAILKRHGIPRRPQGDVKGRLRLPPDERRLTIYLYRDQKMSLREVGNVLGLSRGAVLNRLRRWGIPRRSHSESTKLMLAKLTPAERSQRSRRSYAGLSEKQRERFVTSGVQAKQRAAS